MQTLKLKRTRRSQIALAASRTNHTEHNHPLCSHLPNHGFAATWRNASSSLCSYAPLLFTFQIRNMQFSKGSTCSPRFSKHTSLVLFPGVVYPEQLDKHSPKRSLSSPGLWAGVSSDVPTCKAAIAIPSVQFQTGLNGPAPCAYIPCMCTHDIYGMKNALWWNIHMIYAFRFIPFTSIQCHSIHTWSYVSKSHYHRIITAIQLCNTCLSCTVRYLRCHLTTLWLSFTHLNQPFPTAATPLMLKPQGKREHVLNPQLHMMYPADTPTFCIICHAYSIRTSVDSCQDMSCLHKIRASPYLPAPMPATMTWQKNIGLRNMSCEHAFLWHRLQNARECK